MLPMPTLESNEGRGGAGCTLRDWYIANHCTNEHANNIATLQDCSPRAFPLLSHYFHFWSELGGGTFYTVLICWLVWIDFAEEGIRMCIVLSLGLYTTNVLKDYFSCPRPPSPPVQKGGTASHGHEYGYPSTHTANACLLCYELCYIYLKHQQQQQHQEQQEDHQQHSQPDIDVGYFALIAAASLVDKIICFTLSLILTGHIAFSRVYLGLHWIADIVGGVMVVLLLVLCDAAFFSHIISFLIQNANIPWWFLVLLAHFMLVAHPAPKDPCPCFEDSVRFIGVDAGALIGYHISKRNGFPMRLGASKTTTAAAAAARATTSSVPLLSWKFSAMFLGALGFVLLVRALVSFCVSRILSRLLPFLSGCSCRSNSGGGGASTSTVKGKLYFAVCALAGLLLGKRIQQQQLLLPSLEDKNMETEAEETTTTTTGGGGGSPSPASSIVPVAPQGITTATTLQDDDKGSSHDRPHPVSSTSGVYWTLRNHTHWREEAIVSKFFTYLSMGVAVAWLVPLINAHWDEW